MFGYLVGLGFGVWVFGFFLFFTPAEGSELESSLAGGVRVRQHVTETLSLVQEGLEEPWAGRNGSAPATATVRGLYSSRWHAAAARVWRTTFWEIPP